VGCIKGWPATLTEPDLLDAPVELRPVHVSHVRIWREIKAANSGWLQPWEPSAPEALSALSPGGRRYASLILRSPIAPYVSTARSRWAARRGGPLMWGVHYDGEIAGQLSVFGIAWGSTRSGKLGYWINERYAGHGIIPTAVAMAVDHCFRVIGLHRLEAGIQPQNAASRRVVEKLGFRDEGVRVREVHINGAWRDHICYAITAEDVPAGMLAQWRSVRAPARPAA
jgi:[ribosomal protein S5]-alanine N-acetyltransferase